MQKLLYAQKFPLHTKVLVSQDDQIHSYLYHITIGHMHENYQLLVKGQAIDRQVKGLVKHVYNMSQKELTPTFRGS